MKTIFRTKWLAVKVPTTATGWASVIFSVGAIYLIVAGCASEALDFMQLALLYEILSRISSGKTDQGDK